MWYMGEAGKSAPTVDGYGATQLRKTLVENGKAVAASHAAPDDFMIVLIKPSDKSNYENLVNVLDEMSITGVKSYAIVKIMPIELEALKAQGLLQ
jgi:biopolymer transport protein ExbD